ncbi:kelch repeat and BTB domain-containing protein 12 isoform X2 [Hemicordylus capensis]|uniref:kelch repeat and BTB domain-containing protein 12 isoform X2 n=1 Tax=Hemicordylus capensis TaxID=884348 RepID=UPI002304B0BA|nr:kelch repeat and BTB domain-containing protein 12 isoform X2 [Hemicordylus capensis]
MDYTSEGKIKLRHSFNLLDQIKSMKELMEMIDVVLVAEGEKFPCHKLMLAAFSPYFKAMFTCGLIECTQKEVALHDMSAESVSILLHYMYTAELYLTNCNVQSVAITAYFMQMEDVSSMCQKYMMDHMDASNCVGIYYFAKHIGAEELSDQAGKFLYQHFAEVSLHEEILEIEAQQLLSLIRSDDLNVSREESILDLVLRWVNHSRKPRAGHLMELLKQVRLALVSPSFLVEARKRNTVLLSNSQCSEMIEKALEMIKKSNKPALSLRYGMETTTLLLCIGNNSQGVRSRHGNYADASFCYAPATQKTYFISSPKYGEGLGCVCTGVVNENNDIIVAGEASAAKMSRQKTRNIEIYRFKSRGNHFWQSLCTVQFREQYALGTIHNDLYVIGGQMKLKNQYRITNCVEKYSMEQDNWRTTAPLPVPLACHAVVTVKNRLYIMGGWTPQMDLPDDEPDRLSNRMFQYDPGQDKWTERTPMKYSKYRFSTAVVNNEIYVLARHEVITKEILELDTWENQWNVVAVRALMHDSYDVCLVAQLNPRDLIPPPPDLVEQ